MLCFVPLNALDIVIAVVVVDGGDVVAVVAATAVVCSVVVVDLNTLYVAGTCVVSVATV